MSWRWNWRADHPHQPEGYYKQVRRTLTWTWDLVCIPVLFVNFQYVQGYTDEQASKKKVFFISEMNYSTLILVVVVVCRSWKMCFRREISTSALVTSCEEKGLVQTTVLAPSIRFLVVHSLLPNLAGLLLFHGSNWRHLPMEGRKRVNQVRTLITLSLPKCYGVIAMNAAAWCRASFHLLRVWWNVTYTVCLYRDTTVALVWHVWLQKPDSGWNRSMTCKTEVSNHDQPHVHCCCCCAAVVIVLLLLLLRYSVSKDLPRYARPLFLRIKDELEVTQTFKHKKVNLQKEGFNPNVAKVRLWIVFPRQSMKLTYV